MKSILSFVLLVFLPSLLEMSGMGCAYAQLTVTQGGSATAMASAIVGPGVIVSNATLNCPTQSYGTFAGTSNIGLTNGVLLTTGNINQVPGPASTQLDFNNGTSGGDPDLVAIEPQATFNTCILEFDIIPVCDTLRLSYVFASEEYPDYVCSQYNDVFGFFITGPNPGGGNYNSQNIALIPGTNVAVAINSVNGGAIGVNGVAGGCGGAGDPGLNNTAYYVNNQSGSTITYNGFTVPLVASVPVTSCQTYHLKLAIADAGDPIFDSGVFLEENGITCPGTVVDINVLADTATEGCVSAQIQITRGGDLTTSLNVTLSFSGTATNGSDYTLTNSVTFGTGQSSITLNVPATLDAITEGTEIAAIVGSYTICGTTATTDTAYITITEGPVISFSSVNPACGATNGTITATPNGGTNPYTYSWNTTPAQSTQTATGLAAGTYSVTVTDANNCQADSSLTIGTSPSLTLNTSSTPVACNGGTNGTASVTASGGTTPYTYQWSTAPVQTTQTATGLTAGNYTVTVNDNGGCQNTATVTVNSQSAIVLTTSSTAVTCQGGNDGTATVSTSGGNSPYTYQWNTSPSQTTTTATGLIAGTYSVTVTDANVCTSIANVTVADGAPNADATINPLGPFCDNSPSATLTAATAGGTWSGTGVTGNSFNPATAGAGSHVITYTISGACGDTDTETIVVNATPNATINPVSPLCTGSSAITLTAATSGGTFSGTGVSGNTFNPATAGAGTHTITYTVTVNGCTNTDTEMITVNQSLDATVSPAGPFCAYDPAVNLTAVSSGGVWSGNGITNSSSGTFNPSVAGSGNHLITYSINTACGDTDTVNILVTSVAITSVTGDSTTTCNGTCDGIIIINAAGAGQYSIDNGTTWQGSNVFNNLCAGNYQCIVQDGNGCMDTLPSVVTQPLPILLYPFADFDATCYDACDGYAITIPSGGNGQYTYLWTPLGSTPPVGSGQGTASAGGLCAGNYNLSVTDGNGCASDTDFTIFQPPQGFVTATSSPTLCYGSCDGFANANAFGGTPPFTFLWDNNTGFQTTQTATGLCAGNYVVTATDAAGCPVVTQVAVSQPTLVSVSATGADTICFGSNAVIVANGTGGAGSYTYTWDNGLPQGSTQVVSPSSLTCYSVTATDGNNCQSPPATVCISLFPPLDVMAFFDQTICRYQKVELSASATGGNGTPPTFTWSGIGPGMTVVTYPPGDYPDTVVYYVIADDGCIPDTDSVTITFYQIPVIDYIVDSTFGCVPYTVTFSNQTPNTSSCLWDLGDGTLVQDCGPFDHTYSDPGTYYIDLTIVSSNECVTPLSPATQVVVNPNPLADFSFSPTDPTIINSLIDFTDNSSGVVTSWNWTFYGIDGSSVLGTSQNINPQFTYPSDTGTYPVHLEVTSATGCVDDTTLYLYIDGEFQLFIPNAFTPNGDGNNEFFPPKGIGINPDNYSLYIFDRWGDLIFESHSPDDPWDGTAREIGGTEVIQDGVYVWKIVTQEATREKTEHRFSGNVTLLK